MISHMKSKRIRFEITSEDEAKRYLQQDNYYFRVTAYRKNFPKVNGKYIDLDFAYLQDMVEIDLLLRELILKMSLHLEQSIRSRLINVITLDKREDGYSIVDEFKQYDSYGFIQTMKYLKNNKYSVGLNKKYSSKISAWVFLEIMSFGTLCRFTEFYYNKSGFQSLKETSELLKYCKNLRNAAAHNNCLIINLFSKVERIGNVSQQVRQINNRITEFDLNLLKDRKIHDLLCVFYLYFKYVEKTDKNNLKDSFLLFCKRVEKNKIYYKKCKILKNTYHIVKVMFDTCSKSL